MRIFNWIDFFRDHTLSVSSYEAVEMTKNLLGAARCRGMSSNVEQKVVCGLAETDLILL